MFIECAKFISNITFDTGKDKKVVDFRTFDNGTTSDNLTFLKKLPSTILDKISHFIANTKQQQTQLLSHKVKLDKKTRNVFLDVDMGFFTTI